MALFTDDAERQYARRHMPKPASEDGPWGEAIRYWLNERGWRQADLAVATGIRANTISRTARGFDTTTRVLRKIADTLKVSIDDVLVSPERKLANEDRRRMAREIAEDVLRAMDARSPAAQASVLSAMESAEAAADAIEEEDGKHNGRPKHGEVKRKRR